MGAALRYILGGVAGAFMAMFAEPFFSGLLQQTGIDTSTWAGPVLMTIAEIASEPWFRYLGAAVIGAAIGAWAHWATTMLDRRRSMVSKDIERLLQRVRRLHQIIRERSGDPSETTIAFAMIAEIEQSDHDFWRVIDNSRNRDLFIQSALAALKNDAKDDEIDSVSDNARVLESALLSYGRISK